MNERIAIIDGLRTPFSKAGGKLKTVQADDLGAAVVREVLIRTGLKGNPIDEVVMGNVAQPAHAANIARVISLKAGLPQTVPAATVHRNCASGMESVSTAMNKIHAGEAQIMLVGGTESMSNIPLIFGPEMTAFYERLWRAKTTRDKWRVLAGFRLRFLKPVVGVIQGLTDPVCGLIMGMTAEILAREFHITRIQQDEFALKSHQKAIAATKAGIFQEELMPFPIPPEFKTVMREDEGPRENQTMEALAKLPPYFDRKNGTVTVGNSCPITDGAAAMVVMKESQAKAMGYKPLAFLRAYSYAGLDPSRMGLGPVYATAKVLHKTGLKMSDFERIEMNEAFAAQILACEKAFDSAEFAKTHLNQSTPVGTLNRDILNVNGGAIALGHPVGTTGSRLLITLAKELHRAGKQMGLATLCVGGGQGAAFVVEAT
jgi:acetyl-CoA C-acetyltransferase/acetyl-CoA acyltransferase